MNPIALAFADGTMFFPGILLVMVSLVLAGFFRSKPRLKSVMLTVSIIGVLLVVVSATPLPVWVYGVWGMALTAAWMTMFWKRATSHRFSRVGLLLL
jgi:hypothetical protein